MMTIQSWMETRWISERGVKSEIQVDKQGQMAYVRLVSGTLVEVRIRGRGDDIG